MRESLDNDNEINVVFFISDGEITNGEELKSFSILQEYITDGAVLGYGTSTGGHMKVKPYPGSDKEEYLVAKNYPTKEIALSKIDEKNLEKIATDLNIDYIHMENQSNIDKKIKEIKKYLASETNSGTKEGYVDIYYLFVIPLLVLLIYDYIYYKRRL